MEPGKSTLPNDEREAQDSAYNPDEQAYLEGMGSGRVGSREPNDVNSDSLKDKEEAGDESLSGGLYKPSSKITIDGQKLAKALVFAKKRGPLLGIFGLLGIGGGLLATVFGSSSMLVNLMENINLTNDSTTTSFERRVLKVLTSNANGDATGLCGTSKTIKCKFGRLSNSALFRLENKGLVPLDADGNQIATKRTGYPDKNPASYRIDMGDKASTRYIYVQAKDLSGYLANNPKTASKVLGTSGAFNLRVKVWTGKYMTEKFYKKFSLKRDGGAFNTKDGSNKTADVKERLHKRIPGSEKINSVAEGVRGKVDTHLGKAKKGGTAYTIAVASCIAVKAPAYIAAGVAAVQLAQIMPILMDTVLSPGSKTVASGIDPAAEVSGEQMSAVGDILTEETPRAETGEMASAMSSPYLLAAMGVNTNKLPISAAFTPGFAVLTSDLVKTSNDIDKTTAPACNAILSPAAMYSAMAVDLGITVAASATVIGGIIKIGAGWAITEIAAEATKQVAGEQAKQVLTDLASNDAIPTAQGGDLGDIIGISAPAFYSAGAMSRNVPVLKESQISEFTALQKESADFQRDMDIASLSPFDISSRYTFMGSIVNNIRMASFATGSYKTGIFSTIKDSFGSLFGLTPSVSANGFTDQTCGYAEQFGLKLDASHAADTPAINVAGLPCTGLTAASASMTTDTAITLIQNEGWLDETKDIEDDSTIDDLLASGYIKADTPLADYISDCSDASTGDYLFKSAGCTVNTVTKDINTIPTDVEIAEDDVTTGGSLNDGTALSAIPVFLIDYQITQILNGGDDEDSGISLIETEDVTVAHEEVETYTHTSTIPSFVYTPTQALVSSSPKAVTFNKFNAANAVSSRQFMYGVTA